MSTLQELLEIVPERYSDKIWLNENIDDIYEAIAANLKSADYSQQAISDLIYIYPHLINREDLRRWARLIREAHKVYKNLQKQRDKTNAVGNLFKLTQRPKQFRPTKRRRRERIDSRELLEIYLILLMSRLYQDPTQMQTVQINDMLHFARSVNDPHLYHKVYQTVALIYNERHNFDKALDYARLSYEYWRTQDIYADELPRFEMALTLYTIAVAYRGMGDVETAAHWMNRSADLFMRTSSTQQYGLVAHEMGCIKLLQEEYEAAGQWFEISIREFNTIEAKLHTATAIMHIGMVHAYLHQWEYARENLNRAIADFNAIGANYHRLKALHMLAFVEAKDGKLDLGYEIADNVLQEINQLPSTEWKDFHSHQTEILLDAIRARTLDHINSPKDWQ
ncbi:MAG: hypothetical protein OHK0046_19700 [Anaerolineae bacterium]